MGFTVRMETKKVRPHLIINDANYLSFHLPKPPSKKTLFIEKRKSFLILFFLLQINHILEKARKTAHPSSDTFFLLQTLPKNKVIFLGLRRKKIDNIIQKQNRKFSNTHNSSKKREKWGSLILTYKPNKRF